MAIREILRLGDPRLRQVAKPLANPRDPLVPSLLSDLHDTMAAHSGAGLAAPQIGVPLRVVVYGTDAINPRYPQEVPVQRTVLINPVLTPIGDAQQQGWEGCLSVPGLRGQVKRWRKIRLQGWNGEGEPIDQVVEDFHARVVQHECDHLDGVLFPDCLCDPTAFGFIPELEAAGVIPAVLQTSAETPELHRHDLQIIIEHPEGQPGDILIACFDNADDWMTIEKSFRTARKPCPASGQETHVVFRDLPHGTYACCAMLDGNGNQRMDCNLVGYPLEPFGFSNGAQGAFGPPDFSAAAFVHQGATCLRIALR